MKIKQDPITKLWCREDGAVIRPPNGYRFKRFQWTFGIKHHSGYRFIWRNGKPHAVHRVVCRAFHGLPPAGKTEVDHINRVKDDNRSCNLRYADRSLNCTNKDCVDRAFEKYGVRVCDDRKAYMKSYYGVHREERKAYDAAKLAKMKAQGLAYRKGPDGKGGWYPRICTTNQDKEGDE